MTNLELHRENIRKNGFDFFDGIYSAEEVAAIIRAIGDADHSNNTFRKTNDLFAIRRFLKEVPGVEKLIFNERLSDIISQLFSEDYFPVKAIYFDKPENSNWFVAWHQDLTISVDKKIVVPGYGPWTVKPGQYAVQPPLEILQNNFTIRIHLDDTDDGNGALKVISGSHLKNVARVEEIEWEKETIETCDVKAGGIMIMRPLLMHSSNRTTNSKMRRVIHIEFSNAWLPQEINWAEREPVGFN